MSLHSELQARLDPVSATPAHAPAVTTPARERNPLTPPTDIRFDAETIRAALSVLPTAVADGEE